MNFKELAESYDKMSKLKNLINQEERRVDGIYDDMAAYEYEIRHSPLIYPGDMDSEIEKYKAPKFEQIADMKRQIRDWNQDLAMLMAKNYILKDYLDNMIAGGDLTQKALQELSTSPYANITVTKETLQQLSLLKYASSNNTKYLDKIKRSVSKESVLDKLKRKTISHSKPKPRMKEYSL